MPPVPSLFWRPVSAGDESRAWDLWKAKAMGK
jgi:hypothetical protein